MASHDYKHTLLLFSSSMTPIDSQRLPPRELTPRPLPQSKALELPDNAVLPYDVLVLTDTLQDSTANTLTAGLDEGEVQQVGGNEGPYS